MNPEIRATFNFVSSLTFSWFFRWSFRRKALLQISHRNVLVCEWIKTCLFSLNLEVNFLSHPAGNISMRPEVLVLLHKYFYLQFCIRRESRPCECTRAVSVCRGWRTSWNIPRRCGLSGPPWRHPPAPHCRTDHPSIRETPERTDRNRPPALRYPKDSQLLWDAAES